MSTQQRGTRRATTLAIGAMLVLGACSSPAATTAPDADGGSPGSGGGADPAAALAELEGQVLSTGPNGEEPTAAAEIELTDEELAEVQGMGATAAIIMHLQSDWAGAQVDGVTATFEELGIEIVASTNAEGEVDRQVSDIETALTQNPDIIVSIPLDPAATAAAYRQAADAGVLLVFMDNVPADFEAGTDYVSAVSADNYGNGVASAHLMAQALGGQGTIGVVFFDVDFFVTNQRHEAFVQTITDDYPGIEIVEEQGFSDTADLAGEGDGIASAFLTRNPELDGIWAVWDGPAEGVLAAARTAGRDDLVITTIDLGLNVAINIKQGGNIYGLGAQRPYDQGVAEATLAAYGLLGKEAPPYVALPALPVTADNVLEAWEAVYHQPPPDQLAGS